MSTLPDDTIFWIEVQWNALPRNTGLLGPFTNSTKDHNLLRNLLNRLCTHRFFEEQDLIKPSVTVFDAALTDPTYASLNDLTVKAAIIDGTGSRPAFTLRLLPQSSRPLADALRAALGTARFSFVDLFAVVLYVPTGRLLPCLANSVNLHQAVSSVRHYGDPSRVGFPLRCRSIQTFLRRAEAYALADQLLADNVLPSDTVHARTVINHEMIGVVEKTGGFIGKLVMILHIDATEHHRRKSYGF